MKSILQQNKWLTIATILSIVCIVTLPRLYKIDTPIIEKHSHRQVDTLAVARNFVRDGYRLLYPTYDDVYALQTGVPNPKGYRMVEFPIYNTIIASITQLTRTENFHIVGRWVSILCTIGSAYLIYRLMRNVYAIPTAIYSVVYFAVLPFFVFYTRAVIPEQLSIFFVLASIAYAQKNKPIGSAICWSLALLAKPPAFFFIIPILWELGKHAISPHTSIQSMIRRCIHSTYLKQCIYTIILFSLALTPLLLWRWWISHFPEGIPFYSWLFRYTSTEHGMIDVFFRPVFLRWIIWERLIKLILGYWLTPVLITGICVRIFVLWRQRRDWYRSINLVDTMIMAATLYVCTFQGGNVQHEYYQIFLFPTIAIVLGLGTYYWSRIRVGLIAVGLLLVLACWQSWSWVHHYYYSLSDIPSFASVVKKHTTRADRIVTDTGGDTTVLYYFDRIGSPVIYSDPVTMKHDGYTHVFTWVRETADNFVEKYPVKILIQTDKFTLIKL